MSERRGEHIRDEVARDSLSACRELANWHADLAARFASRALRLRC